MPVIEEFACSDGSSGIRLPDGQVILQQRKDLRRENPFNGRELIEKEVELLNKTEAVLLRLMAQYKSGQYAALGECISNIRAVREHLSLERKSDVEKDANPLVVAHR